MGKIRVKTLGSEELEEQDKKKIKQKKEQKKLVKIAGMKGHSTLRDEPSGSDSKSGERVVAVGPTEEELEKLEVSKVSEVSPIRQVQGKQVSKGEEKKEKKEKPKTTKTRERSKRYQAAKILVDRTKVYPLIEALELLPKLKISKMDETVELHINAVETGISGNLNLPHGTGKKTRVVTATDELIEQIEKNLSAGRQDKIDFDILIATPDMMPKLAKVAKVLGPRGLMPNPKSGTITDKPEELVKKYAGGQIRFKTEAKAPVIHLTVGKLSFGTEKLADNIKTAVQVITQGKIKNITLKSTMSPGIKIDVSN